MTKEKIFENKVKAYLSTKGIYFVKFFANRMTRIGVPDILSCINGKFVGIEVKSENGKPSYMQCRNISLIQQNDGFAIVLYPEDFRTFCKMVEAIITGNWLEARKLENSINSKRSCE